MDHSNNRNRHEAKPGPDARLQASHGPSTRAHPKWRVGNADREPRPRADTVEEFELTGQWRHTGERYHLFINHAGPHIEMLLALVESGSFGNEKDVPRDKLRSQTRLFRFGGDVDSSERDVYHLYAQPPDGRVDVDDLRCGSMRHSHGGKRLTLNIDLSGLPNTEFAHKFDPLRASMAVRFGQAPNLLENHLNKVWVPPEVRTAHWFPLTPTQEKEIPNFIIDVRITLNSENYDRHSKANPRKFGYVELVERYFDIMGKAGPFTPLTLQDKQHMSSIASALDRLVFVAWNTALQCPAWKGGIDSSQTDYWRVVTLDGLERRKLEIDPAFPRSLLTHTQAIIDRWHEGVSMEEFKERLYLQKQFGGHNYTAELEIIDIDGTKDDATKALAHLIKKVVKKNAEKIAEKITRQLPFGCLAGTLTVDKPDPGKFHAGYVIVLGGLKISKGIGTSGAIISSSGKALNVYGPAWRPENIRGTAVLVEAGGSWFGGGGGKGRSLSMLRCRGSGKGKPPTPLNINFSGLSEIISYGAGGSLSFMRYAGMILDGALEGGEVSIPDDRVSLAYGVHPTESVHFPINGAELQPAACRILEIFAACELAVLSRKGVRLEVHGYADQPDDDLNNMILSRNRAISVFNYLKNILGGRLRVPDLKDVPSEDEEREDARAAKESGKSHTIADPSDGNSVIVAHGEPKSDAASDKKEKPKYNSNLRRVEVYVDGEIRLMLRRTHDDGA